MLIRILCTPNYLDVIAGVRMRERQREMAYIPQARMREMEAEVGRGAMAE